MIERLLVFILGSIIGSFLNVCIHRLPLGQSIIWPGSHCPRCRHRIPWHDNIPFLSYLLLRGRCRFCRGTISFVYFTVESLTALLFLAFFNLRGLSFDFFFYSVFACGLIVATFVDMRHRIIPDEISIGGIAAGIIFGLVRPLATGDSYTFGPALSALTGALAGGGLIYSVGFLFDLVYFKLLNKPPVQGETSSMGGGDVKLLAMIGAFLGWQKAIFVFFTAPFFGVIVGVINLLAKKEHVIPYGPFLSLAALLSVFWADRVISFILLR